MTVLVSRDDPLALTEKWLSYDLDEWTRKIVQRHFHPETGSPYWLRRMTTLGFEPGDIRRYEDLEAFGPFPLAELRKRDPAEFVPSALPRPLAGRIWESGGTTGDPCRVFYTAPMMLHRSTWRHRSWINDGFEPGRSWLYATPSGPHIISWGMTELTELFDARVYALDIDPRWVKRLLRAGRLDQVNDYTNHIIDQMTLIMKSQHIDYLTTTPALLRALLRRSPELVAGLRGLRLSGTQITATMYREFLAALDGGILSLYYGNTFGVANGLAAEDDGAILPSVPNYPHVTMEVVEPDDWRTAVPYQEYGQVKLTLLQEDLFLPNILERDRALRYDVAGRWPCDGIANVSPLQSAGSQFEGIY